jgi:hypothetical protein
VHVCGRSTDQILIIDRFQPQGRRTYSKIFDIQVTGNLLTLFQQVFQARRNLNVKLFGFADLILHISDISQTSMKEGNMVEVATAAAVGYPCQWRVATCNTAAGKLQLRSVTLQSLPSDADFNERARDVFTNCIPTMTRGVLTRYWPEISQAISNYREKHPHVMRFVTIPDTPEAIADLLLRHLQQPVTRAYIAFAEGNEGGNDNTQLIEQLIKGVDQIVDKTVKGILKPLAKAALHLRIYGTFKLVLRSILEDLNDIGTKHETVINDHTAIIGL